MKGILNLYKPKGITSAAVIAKVKRILNTREVGHFGTLDPQGEGVLLAGVGKATRLFDYFLTKDKVYEADFTFGYQTDTLDGDGAITARCDKVPTIEELITQIPKLAGIQDQLPPAYSAKSIGGIRAYDLARQGKEVILKPARIEIYDVRIIQENSPTFRILIHCSSGTYIRSICRDLAVLTDSLATMTSIKRTRAGSYNVSDSVTLERLETLKESALQSAETALNGLKRIDLPHEYQVKLQNGVKFSLPGAPKEFALYCNDTLYGIAENTGERVRIKTYLKD